MKFTATIQSDYQAMFGE